MQRKIFDYFEIAAKTALSKEDKRSFLLGAVGVRKDGAMVKSLNSPTEIPFRKMHSEYKLCRKLDYGATVYVARVRLDTGKFGMARPCFSCMKVLLSKKVKRVHYTISEDQWGTWHPIDNIDTYHYFK